MWVGNCCMRMDGGSLAVFNGALEAVLGLMVWNGA